MTKKGENGHRTKLTLRIDLHVCGLWLAGDAAAQDMVAAACHSWLRFCSQGLSPDDLAEITWAAMADAFIKTREKGLKPEESLLTLQRALNAQRQAEKRWQQRFLAPLAQDPISTAVFDGDEAFERQFWHQAVRLIERHMQVAYICLSERDQGFLAHHYGLEVGDPTPGPPPLNLSPAAEKQALYRARRRFNRQLESLLLAEVQEVNRFDRPLYEAALRIVRGGVAPVLAGLK